MKRWIALFCGLMIAQPAFAQTASEKADKRLAELLAPGGMKAAPYAEAAAWKASRAVEEIPSPVKPYAGPTARLPQAPLKGVKPRSAREGTPLTAYREQPVGPKEIELPTQPLIRLPSVDVHAPLPIPILSQPLKDRAPLGDPAFDASVDATLKQLAPKRDQPVPFVPLNLPDPFENVRTGQLRNPPEENAMPPVIPLTKPTK